MPLDRLIADLHGQADFLVGEVVCQKFQYFTLLRGQCHARRDLRPGKGRGVELARGDLGTRAFHHVWCDPLQLFGQHGMDIDEDALQPKGVRQVGGFPQQVGGAVATVLERQRP